MGAGGEIDEIASGAGLSAGQMQLQDAELSIRGKRAARTRYRAHFLACRARAGLSNRGSRADSGGSLRRGAPEAYAAFAESNAVAGRSIRRLCRFLSQLQKPFVGQAAQDPADVRQNSLARRCVALRRLIDQLGESDLASVQHLMISAAMASALNTRSGEGLPACAAARADHPPTPAGMSGSDSSIAENLPPPPSPGLWRSIGPIQDRRKWGSELGRQIPIDLQADADLNESWGCP